MTIPRILVVDDDPEMRQMMTQFLRKHGTIALPAAPEAEVAAHLEGGRASCQDRRGGCVGEAGHPVGTLYCRLIRDENVD